VVRDLRIDDVRLVAHYKVCTSFIRSERYRPPIAAFQGRDRAVNSSTRRLKRTRSASASDTTSAARGVLSNRRLVEVNVVAGAWPPESTTSLPKYAKRVAESRVLDEQSGGKSAFDRPVAQGDPFIERMGSALPGE
jgi:hypothetical protein